MAVDAGTERPLSAQVHDALRERILSGELSAGDALPGERTLSESFGVNRHAVREAIKRLQQAGLVRVSHGGSSRVLDWRRHAGLDLLADLPLAGDAPALAVLRSALEMRRSIGVDAARLCALRAGPDLAGSLGDALAALERARSTAARFDSYTALWELVIEGSGNVAYRLALNSLLAGLHPLGDRTLVLHADELADADCQRGFVAALADGDADGAAAAADSLLRLTLDAAVGEQGNGDG